MSLNRTGETTGLSSHMFFSGRDSGLNPRRTGHRADMAWSRSNKAFIAGPVLLVFYVLTVILAGPIDCRAEDYREEYEVKAAFIYNFIRFIEWTNDAGAEMAVCVAGDNPFGAALNKISGKTVRGKKIVIRQVEDIDGSGCNVLFIGSSEEWHISQIARDLSGLNILTIGDTKGYARKGIIINFYMEGNRVRFEINTEAAEKSGLRISSKLLGLAAIVHTGQ